MKKPFHTGGFVRSPDKPFGLRAGEVMIPVGRTITGRLSTEPPEMQELDRRVGAKAHVVHLDVPSPLVTADYSEIEKRVMVNMAKATGIADIGKDEDG